MSRLGKIITGASIALVILLVIGSLLYLTLVAPYQKVLIKIGNETARVNYILKRIVANPNGYDVAGTMQNLVSEMIMRQEASTLGVAAVTEADIDAQLKEEAKATNENMTDEEYQKWYHDLFSQTPLNEKLFRDYIARQVLYRRVYEALAAQVQTSGPQSHLWVLVANSEADANKAIARIQGGEEFAKVAAEVSTDTTSKTKGGDLDFMPLELMGSQFTSTLNALEVGKLGTPVSFQQQNSQGQTTTAYAVFQITEKEENRPYSDNSLNGLKNRALSGWLSQQSTLLDAQVRGHSSAKYDAETQQWLSYEAQKLGKKYSSIGATISTGETVTETTAAPTTTAPSTTTPSPTTSTPPSTTTSPPSSTAAPK
jgi:hypothetical protein